MQHFAVFGSHPRLSLAEFHSIEPKMPQPQLFGAAAIFESDDWNGGLLNEKLGGTVKLGDVIGTFSNDSFSPADLIEALPRQPKGSFDFGCTVYGGSTAQKTRFKKFALELKKEFKARSLSSRWVTGKDGEEIAPAAIAKLHLTTEGFDFNLFVSGNDILVGLTTHVQDADAWSERDYGRPARSEDKGMLPPKLARMMVNLVGVGRKTILDPFCGSGTVLMEAALATDVERIIGSDLDPAQVADTKENDAWLKDMNILTSMDAERIECFVADARKLGLKLDTDSIDGVVSEGFLGPALRGGEPLSFLQKNTKEISLLWINTLKELHPLLTDDARLVCIWPSFKTDHGMARVDIEEELGALGYSLVDPFDGWDEVAKGPLLYHRVGQRVMRRIVLLDKVAKSA